MTDREPTKEQMVMYTYTDVVPCAGATCSMKKSVTATAVTTYSKKPAAKTKVGSASCRCHGDESDALVLSAMLLCNMCQVEQVMPVTRGKKDSDADGCPHSYQSSCLPDCIASCHTCNKDVIGVSSGACNTIVREPAIHSIPPSRPKRLSRSLRR